MIIGFSKVEGITDWNRNRINLYRNTQILILEFEYMWSGPRNYGSDATG
jgi:hypothetical protein